MQKEVVVENLTSLQQTLEEAELKKKNEKDENMMNKREKLTC